MSDPGLRSPLSFTVTSQGGPIVNDGWYYEGDYLVIVEIDFRSKRCEISMSSGLEVWFDGSNALHTGDSNELTGIEIHGFEGYRIFAMEMSKHTFRACLYDSSKF